MTVDEGVIILTPDAPLTDFKYCSVGWSRSRSRCEADGDTIYRVPIPPDFIYSPAILIPNEFVRLCGDDFKVLG